MHECISCSGFTNESLLRNVWLAINNKRFKVTDDKACWLSRAGRHRTFRNVDEASLLSACIHHGPDRPSPLDLFLLPPSLSYPSTSPSASSTKTDLTPTRRPRFIPGELFFDLSLRSSSPVINIREQLSLFSPLAQKRSPADFSRTPFSLPRKVKLPGSPRIQRKIDHPTWSFSGKRDVWISRATKVIIQVGRENWDGSNFDVEIMDGNFGIVRKIRIVRISKVFFSISSTLIFISLLISFFPRESSTNQLN